MKTHERLVPIDVLKGVGIVSVVWIHATSDPAIGEPGLHERTLLQLTRFAVPGFLAVSGYLYATRESVPLAATLGRLRRVLVPYLLASALAQLYWWALGTPHAPIRILRELLDASSFGPYYYVFVITTMILLTPLLARIPPRGVVALWVLLFASYGLRIAIANTGPERDPADLYWFLRDPTNGGTYFVAGWLCALYRRPLAAACGRFRSALAATGLGLALLLSVLAVWPDARLLQGLAGWLNIFVVMALLVAFSLSLRESPPALRFASDATYTVYLYHLFFLYTVMQALPSVGSVAGRLALELAGWGAGLVGSGLLVAASRRVLGARARVWFGA
jgi:surface polysaccharide O-acyltransferase-like enzyme